MPHTGHHDALYHFERVHLEKLRLACEILIELGDDGVTPDPLETELRIFKDRVECALLLPAMSPDVMPRPATVHS